MENNFEIIPLFPVPLLKVPIPNSFSNMATFFQNQPLKDKLPNKADFGVHSKNTYILDENECKDLKDFILNITLKYTTEFLNYSYKSYKFSQSWISIKEPNQSHNIHTHSNSLISGVLYYGKILPETSSILFHRSNSNVHGSHLLKPKENHDNPNFNIYTTPIYSLYPSPGDLILFPSWLPHSVPLNITNSNRYSLAFNIVPTEGFGTEGDLTELKFN